MATDVEKIAPPSPPGALAWVRVRVLQLRPDLEQEFYSWLYLCPDCYRLECHLNGVDHLPGAHFLSGKLKRKLR